MSEDGDLSYKLLMDDFGLDAGTIHNALSAVYSNIEDKSPHVREGAISAALEVLQVQYPTLTKDKLTSIIEEHPVLSTVWNKTKIKQQLITLPSSTMTMYSEEGKKEAQAAAAKAAQAQAESYEFADALLGMGFDKDDIAYALSASQALSGNNIINAFRTTQGAVIEVMMDNRREMDFCKMMAHDASVDAATGRPNVSMEDRLEYLRRYNELSALVAGAAKSIQSGVETLTRAIEANNERMRQESGSTLRSTRKAKRVS